MALQKKILSYTSVVCCALAVNVTVTLFLRVPTAGPGFWIFTGGKVSAKLLQAEANSKKFVTVRQQLVSVIFSLRLFNEMQNKVTVLHL